MTNEEYAEIMDNSNFMIDSANPYDMKIKEALEKQIPKKPFITKFNNGAELIHCGECYMCSHITRIVDYCPYCGQKIDWRNEQ